MRKDGFCRPSREDLHMVTAFLWAQRSLDPRHQNGAVVTTPDMKQVLAIGYNGPAKGLPHTAVRDTPGDSGCLHAEDNAIAFCNSTIPGKVMFVTTEPCEMCAQRIVNAGFARVFYVRAYRIHIGADILAKCKVPLIRMVYAERSETSFDCTHSPTAIAKLCGLGPYLDFLT